MKETRGQSDTVQDRTEELELIQNTVDPNCPHIDRAPKVAAP